MARLVPSANCLNSARSNVSATPVPPPVKAASLPLTAVVSPSNSISASLPYSAKVGSVIIICQLMRTLWSTISGVTTKVTVDDVGVQVSVNSDAGSDPALPPVGKRRRENAVLEQSSTIPGPGVSVTVTLLPTSAAVKSGGSTPVTASFPAALGSSSSRTNLSEFGNPNSSWMKTVSVNDPFALTNVKSLSWPSSIKFWFMLAMRNAVPEMLFMPSTNDVKVKVITPLLTVATATTLPFASVRSKVNESGISSSGGNSMVKKSPATEPLGTIQSTLKSKVLKMVELVCAMSTSVIASVISAASADDTAKDARSATVMTTDVSNTQTCLNFIIEIALSIWLRAPWSRARMVLCSPIQSGPRTKN